MHKQKLDLDDVKQNFEEWRGSRTKQGKIPDYLWACIFQPKLIAFSSPS